MRKNSILLIILAVVVTTIVNQILPKLKWEYFTNSLSSHQFQSNEHWSYEGETSPEHWCEIVKNSSCDGEKQSPINIIELDCEFQELSEVDLKIRYNEETNIYDIKNNGHTIMFDFEEGDSIYYEGFVYPLKQIHFHEPSEHTINGIRYPIEAHFVHSNAEINQHVVLSILGKEGSKHKPFYFLQQYLPIDIGESKKINKPYDISRVFPENKEDLYIYQGSLTTPPCSENVNWIIFRDPIELSVEQVVQMKKQMPLNNFRNEQALNMRVVKKTFN